MRKREAAIIFIFVTVTLDMLAIGLIGPVLPRLVLDFLGGDMKSAAVWNGVFGTVFFGMQFLFSPVLGVLSDRFGRRPVILLSNLGLGLDYIVMALAPTMSWLLLGRIFSGITASSIPTAMAYIADITPRQKRAAAFGMVSVAFGLGFVLGPAIGGLLGNVNPRIPFWIAAGFSLTNWLWGYFFLPESLAQAKRKQFTLRRANPVGSLVLLRSHPELWRLATVQFLSAVAHNAFSIWALYAIYRYTWTVGQVGFSLAVVGVCTGLVSGGLTPRMVARFGERRTLFIGQFFGACGMVMAGLARTGGFFLASIPVISTWNISMPAIQSMMVHRVNEREQGELQGAIGSLRSLAFLIGPGLFSWTFAYFVDPARPFHLPGAPYFLAGALLFIAMLMATRVEQPEMTAKSIAPSTSSDTVPPEVTPDAAPPRV